MVMKAKNKLAGRLLLKHFARFLTIVAIVIVSIGFMSGVGELENKIYSASNITYEKYNMSDLYVKSKTVRGFSEQEKASLTQKFGEDNVEFLMSYELEEEGKTTRIYSFDLKNSKINKLELLEGEFPKEGGYGGEDGKVLEGVVVERKTSDFDSYKLRDEITIMGKTYTVCGIVFNPLFTAKQDEPSFTDEDKSLNKVIYVHSEKPLLINDAYITTDRTLFDGFGDKYENHIDTLKTETKALFEEDRVEVLSLYENYGLYSQVARAEKIGIIAMIFLVFFLLVTLLVTYSTMTRLFEEERSQMACMSTLGYKKTQIVFKYVGFVALATLIGGIIAYFVGYGLNCLLYTAFHTQYQMPAYPNNISLAYYLITMGITFVCTTVLTFIYGMSLLKDKPASLLVPKAPKSGKKVFLEKIPFIWNNLSFKYKSTLRNVFLFKSRFFMTVISVTGATVLVFAGMGLLDCIQKMKNAQMLVFVAFAIIFFSALLCALVIYNITNINVSERRREIATLMVLGYHDGEVSGYIFREIYIMSLIGAILGVPCGMGILIMAFEMLEFGGLADVNWWTYLLTPCITMFFVFVSTFLLRGNITKTDMNASLKTLE